MPGQADASDAMAADPDRNLVKETTTTSFRADVIAESARQPVLVDFWAPWCGPCKQLAPVIEKAVKSAGGKVKLVKMNIDDHPQVAGQLGIKSIPAVIAFQNGQPVDGFMGALPEGQIRTFIERLVGPLVSGVEEILQSAEAALESGDVEAAVEQFQTVIGQDPENGRAIGGLAQALIAIGDTEAAGRALETVSSAHEKEPAVTAARASLKVAQQAAEIGDLGEITARLETDPTDHAARLDLAVALNGLGKRDDAANALLEIIRRDRSWNDDGARKQLVQFFEAWGPMDPATISARRKLSAVLFS